MNRLLKRRVKRGSKKKRKRHRKKNTKKRRTFKRKYRKTKKKKINNKKNKKSTKKGGDWGDICPICQYEMNKWSYKTIALCPCNHEFHRKCVIEWLKKQQENIAREGEKYKLTCPLCRVECTIKSLKNKVRFKIPKISLKKRKKQPERVITAMRRQFLTQQRRANMRERNSTNTTQRRRRDNNTRIVPQSTRDYTDFWNNVE